MISRLVNVGFVAAMSAPLTVMVGVLSEQRVSWHFALVPLSVAGACYLGAVACAAYHKYLSTQSASRLASQHGRWPK